MTKMTYVNAIDNAIALFSQGGQIDVEDRETVEKLEALKATLINRKSGSKGMTKTQKENEEIKKLIFEVLTDADHAITISEMLKDSRLNGYSNQKMSALLRQMCESGKATKTKDRKLTLFEIADSDDDAQYLDREVTV